MKFAHTYKAFGLVFQSEFEIPEFIVSEGFPDVVIKNGAAPEHLSSVKKGGVKYQASKNEFLLEVDQVAKYYVCNGNEIVVEPISNPEAKEIRLFLLGSVLGALFIQRGLLPIHGSAIKFGNSVSVFSGMSGVGKSSIAACFVSKGFQFLADDISLVDEKGHVIPGFPNMKIWKDILDKLEIEETGLSSVRPELGKFQLPVKNAFYEESLLFEKLFILNSKNTPGFEFEELSGLQKFNAVKNNTYRYRFVGGLDKHLNHFQALNKLLPNIKVYRVLRPQSPIMLDEFAEFLINTFELSV